ncbi:MAG: SUMF1/EgtB/PvdO family nonheme iron enzyme [Muribaculaceae bacterium]|nr:SUMF1/EgtB/PvdO family nonheme iron enzyme [Muribaculaceae bacterium]
MNHMKYDIFISYRREGGAQYARALQLFLENKRYRVFLDYDELTDSVFSDKIKDAIKNSSVFIIILSKNSLDRCINDDDWVRQEIECAINNNIKIVPVNPDNTFTGIPQDVPKHIRNTISSIHYSEINFGQALKPTAEMMIRNRLPRKISTKLMITYCCVGIFLTIGLLCAFLFYRLQQNSELEELKQSVTFQGESPDWNEDITKEQLLAFQRIFNSMREIKGGEFMQGAIPLPDGSYHEFVEEGLETPARHVVVRPFYISQFETTIGDWNAIMNDKREGNPEMPVGDVSYDEATEFTNRLYELSGLEFRLPTESEWEYAARGGESPENFIFAGDDNPGKVAWFSKNSNGKPHSNDASDLPETCTSHDLFNMSGNLSEWVDTEFKPYNPEFPVSEIKTMTIRGGNYNSEPYELTVTHRQPSTPYTKLPTLGFRIAL